MNAPVLSVLVGRERTPWRTRTGIEGLKYANLEKNGPLLSQGSTSSPQNCYHIEAKESLVSQLQPLISDWLPTDRAILALRMEDMTFRQIQKEIGVSPCRISKVVRLVREFLNG